ncbi:hypothetical protein GCM10027059_08830 [Myceligenerans halotolerans]
MRKSFTPLPLTASRVRDSVPDMASDDGESRFETTPIHLDEVHDIGDLDAPAAALFEYWLENLGSRFGLVKDGLVIGVVMDRVDASIFEHLQVRYQDMPGEHQARAPRVSTGTIENEKRRAQERA